MSSGHLRGEERTPAELKKILATGDTAKLLAQPIKIDCSHDVPDLGGISVDRKTAYVDQQFVADLKAGRVRVPGMTWRQVVDRVVRHEHGEKSVIDGDNPVDVYPPAHELATVYEHEGLTTKQVELYEGALKSVVDRAEHERIENPPRDLWCGPYLDDPDADDKKDLRAFRARGVADAFKLSKDAVNYRKAAREVAACCVKCAMWERDTEQDGHALAQCELVSGLVRRDRVCDRFEARK